MKRLNTAVKQDQIFGGVLGCVTPSSLQDCAHNSDFTSYIYQNLIHSKKISDRSFLCEGLDYSWGTTNAFLEIENCQSILYKKLTGSSEFDSLNIYQRDYILGRNPWGTSFIYNIGTKFSKNLHSQIAFLIMDIYLVQCLQVLHLRRF